MTNSEAHREAAFQRYLESKVAYNAKAAGDEPWHSNDTEARRELFMRRYTRPAPPERLQIPNVRRSA